MNVKFMTCKQLLKMEHPEYVSNIYVGGEDMYYTMYQAFSKYMKADVCATAEVAAPLRESLAKRKENTMKRNNKNEIKKVIFNDPATIVFWRDGSKTVVKAANEAFDHEKGLAMAIAKKHFGNEGNYYDIFKKWLPKKEETKEVAKGDGSLASVVKAFDDTMEEVRRLSNGSDEEAK